MKTILKQIIVFTLLIIFNTVLFSQAPDTIWTKTFGGVYNDYGYEVQQTTDGGYIITGALGQSYDSTPIENVWLVKVDALGDTLWTRQFEYANSIGYGRSVKQTSDNGYIIVGYKELGIPPYGRDLLLIKTDTNGDTLWTKTFVDSLKEGQGNSILQTQGNSIQQTMDGGYIITGSSSADVLLIKMNTNGDTTWTKTYDKNAQDWGNFIQQTSDGGFIIAGVTGYKFSDRGNNFTGDIWLIKTDSNGDTMWTKTYDYGESDIGYSVQQTSDNGYVITGGSNYFNPAFRIIKTNSNGDTTWTKTYGIGYTKSRFIQQTFDDGYIITGTIWRKDGHKNDVLVIKTNSNGDSLWSKTFGGIDNDYGNYIQQTSDGGYIIVGQTRFYGAGESDIWLIKVAPDVTEIDKNQNAILRDYHLKQNYPNPFNPTTTIKFTLPNSEFVTLKIYNILGQETATLVSGKLKAGEYQYSWDAGDLASGIFIYRLRAGKKTESRKMIVIK